MCVPLWLVREMRERLAKSPLESLVIGSITTGGSPGKGVRSAERGIEMSNIFMMISNYVVVRFHLFSDRMPEKLLRKKRAKEKAPFERGLIFIA